MIEFYSAHEQYTKVLLVIQLLFCLIYQEQYIHYVNGES